MLNMLNNLNIKGETGRGSKFATFKCHWHKNYFKLKTIKVPMAHKETLVFSLNA